MDNEKLFLAWIEKINQTETINQSIIAFHFGLFEGTNGYMMYLIGSKSFSIEDDDWPTCINFEPKEKYFTLKTKSLTFSNWEGALKQAKTLLANFIKSKEFGQSIFAQAKAITTGFDDGDLLYILLQ